jgi:hypothetical protein
MPYFFVVPSRSNFVISEISDIIYGQQQQQNYAYTCFPKCEGWVLNPVQDAKEQLSALTDLNLGEDLSADALRVGEGSVAEGAQEKAADAVDYADETEMVDDPDAPDPSKAALPLLWVPGHASSLSHCFMWGTSPCDCVRSLSVTSGVGG